jgi:flagellar basal-body rod modification protein FlgD
MSRVPSINTASTSEQSFGAHNTLNELDLDTFFDLMIAELQNQDPLNPLENDQLLSQISQIREIGATERLSKTLESVLLGQSIASATNLIGAHVKGLSDDGERVEGIVSRVTINDGEPKLFLSLNSSAAPDENTEGNVAAGEYRYVVTWRDETSGKLFGVAVNDGEAVETTGTAGVDKAIRISNLPVSSTPKQIYRTDNTGEGALHLVATLTDSSSASFVDTFSDDELSDLTLIEPWNQLPPVREFTASLKNISEISPPGRGG